MLKMIVIVLILLAAAAAEKGVCLAGQTLRSIPGTARSCFKTTVSNLVAAWCRDVEGTSNLPLLLIKMHFSWKVPVLKLK